MVAIVRAHTAEAAWELAAKELLNAPQGEIQDLVVEIADAASFEAPKQHRFDPQRAGGDRLSDVANTIFPQRTWERSSTRDQLYEMYLLANKRSKHRRWGTYFERLIDFDSGHINQLENAISAIRKWKNSPKSAICFHLSTPSLDTLRPLGLPCLQAIQLHCHPERIDASVFYRNHDYFNKALGNFIGIGRLLNFISYETDRQPGSLVCYSTHAYFEGRKADVRRVIGL